MFRLPKLDPDQDTPLYRQLYGYLKAEILSGRLPQGEKIPPTRELAVQLGLNRMTISSAYELLEGEGLIRTHVGRGSFVAAPAELFADVALAAGGAAFDWEKRFAPWFAAETAAAQPPVTEATISFAASRPCEQLFPIVAFQESCREVLLSPELTSILQLGPAHGYPPLRRYQLEQERSRGLVNTDDDLVITNGCQQALDLLQRLLARPGETVLVEDPIYPGLRNVFAHAGVRIVGAPVGSRGLDVESAARLIRSERPRLLIVTPNFQNPTGTTMPEAARRQLLRVARDAALPIAESDIYGDLRYSGDPLPSLKELDENGLVVQVKSFSKLAFPGLRVGWVTGARTLIRRLVELKQSADLHTGQLEQAVLLRFAESGRLEAHRRKMIEAGRTRLEATLNGCAKHLPAGTRFTHPEGGMNLWVRLPEPLDAAAMLERALAEGVAYQPGSVFEVTQRQPGGLRVSFAGLSPERIERGLAILGQVFHKGLERARAAGRDEPAPAIV